jgi:hypothetical protein
MTEIRLLEQLHSNTRRTRITYAGKVGEREVAIKCYRRPAFGIFHTLRAFIRGRRLRRTGAPLPAIVFVGWVSEASCFGYATEYLTGHRSMRQRLAEASSTERDVLIAALGSTVANLHKLGVEQKDGNLTNFMVDDAGHVALIDEDDISLKHGGLGLAASVQNLANIAARLPDLALVKSLQSSYLDTIGESGRSQWDENTFLEKASGTRRALEDKRSKRNIAPRRFD